MTSRIALKWGSHEDEVMSAFAFTYVLRSTIGFASNSWVSCPQVHSRRVVNPWNNLPVDTDFSSLASLKLY